MTPTQKRSMPALFVACLIAYACHPQTPDRTPHVHTDEARMADPEPPTPEAAPGGFVDQPVDSPQAQDVAAKALELLNVYVGDATLERIVAVESQVVAGTNYRVELDVKSSNLGSARVNVVYHRDLHGNDTIESVKAPQYYVGKRADVCAVIRFACAPGMKYFADVGRCGCEPTNEG